MSNVDIIHGWERELVERLFDVRQMFLTEVIDYSRVRVLVCRAMAHALYERRGEPVDADFCLSIIADPSTGSITSPYFV